MEDKNVKKCGKCQIEKPFDDFNKSKRGTFGLHGHCRECARALKAKWDEENREHIKDYGKGYGKTEKAKLARRNRWERLKEVLGPISNERRRGEKAKVKARIQRSKWIAIPQNKIAQNLRSRIRIAIIRGQISEKFSTTEDLLGCNFNELRKYIEERFVDGMSWGNYGVDGWHIDHIIPCSAFDLTLESEQRKCFHFTNLRPLWAKDNLSKGNKIIIE